MNRIEAIASLVDNDALVVDIGTDHAYLPIYLYENDITKNIVASDISSNALLFAKNNLEKQEVFCEGDKLDFNVYFNISKAINTVFQNILHMRFI